MRCRKGDVLGFLMENRPEYFSTWLGLAKIGVIPGLITNTILFQVEYVLLFRSSFSVPSTATRLDGILSQCLVSSNDII